jgi:hypothetical protein
MIGKRSDPRYHNLPKMIRGHIEQRRARKLRAAQWPPAPELSRGVVLLPILWLSNR